MAEPSSFAFGLHLRCWCYTCARVVSSHPASLPRPPAEAAAAPGDSLDPLLLCPLCGGGFVESINDAAAGAHVLASGHRNRELRGTLTQSGSRDRDLPLRVSADVAEDAAALGQGEAERRQQGRGNRGRGSLDWWDAWSDDEGQDEQYVELVNDEGDADEWLDLGFHDALAHGASDLNLAASEEAAGPGMFSEEQLLLDLSLQMPVDTRRGGTNQRRVIASPSVNRTAESTSQGTGVEAGEGPSMIVPGAGVLHHPSLGPRVHVMYRERQGLAALLAPSDAEAQALAGRLGSGRVSVDVAPGTGPRTAGIYQSGPGTAATDNEAARSIAALLQGPSDPAQAQGSAVVSPTSQAAPSPTLLQWEQEVRQDARRERIRWSGRESLRGPEGRGRDGGQGRGGRDDEVERGRHENGGQGARGQGAPQPDRARQERARQEGLRQEGARRFARDYVQSAEEFQAVLDELLREAEETEQGLGGPGSWPACQLAVASLPRLLARRNGAAWVLLTSSGLEEQARALKMEADVSRAGELHCTVCREDVTEGDELVELPCRHLFHSMCLLPWLESHCSCPLCRYMLPASRAATAASAAAAGGSSGSGGPGAGGYRLRRLAGPQRRSRRGGSSSNGVVANSEASGQAGEGGGAVGLLTGVVVPVLRVACVVFAAFALGRQLLQGPRGAEEPSSSQGVPQVLLPGWGHRGVPGARTPPHEDQRASSALALRMDFCPP